MASKARDLSNFISTAAIDASEIGTGAITTDKIADTTITHAKLHTTMDLSGKTVTLPTINALDVTNNINVGGTVDGVDIQTLNTAVAANTAKTGITSGQATAITAALPKAGGTLTGPLGITTASTADTVVLTRGTTGHNNMLKFKTGSADKWIVGQRNDSTDHFRFYSYGTSSDVLSILTDGKVGIGNSNPQGRLHLNDSGTAVPTSGYGTGLMVSRTDGLMGTMFGFLNSPQSGYLQSANFTNSDTLPFLINPRGGNVGIGTTAPANRLHVDYSVSASSANLAESKSVATIAYQPLRNGSNYGMYFGNTAAAAGYVQITDGSSTGKMNINPYGGSVGINNASPNHSLDVNGDTVQNGVRTFTARFNVQNNVAIGFDVVVPNEGGGGNSFMIHCGHNHYYISAYGTHRIAMVSTRGTNISDVINVGHQTSGNGGSWTFSKPSATLLRITKNAGSYGGGGAGFIHVVFSSFM